MPLDTAERLKLRAEAQKLRAEMNIGKFGITAAVVDEVDRQLQEHRLLKVKLLASAREAQGREDLARDLAERTGAELVEIRGNTAVLWRRGKRKASNRGQNR
jgi:RNA-binding protein